MEPITAEALREKLKKEKTVQVCGLTFRIRRAPLLLLGEEAEDLWSLARQGHEILSGRIKDMVASPTLPRMKRILLSGVVEPRFAYEDQENAICVDHVLAHHELATGLFIEVVNFSLTPPEKLPEA